MFGAQNNNSISRDPNLALISHFKSVDSVGYLVSRLVETLSFAFTIR